MNRLQNKNMAGPVCFRVSGKRTERPQPRWFAGVQGRSPCPPALASRSERPWPARNERQPREGRWARGREPKVSEPLHPANWAGITTYNTTNTNSRLTAGGHPVVHPAVQARVRQCHVALAYLLVWFHRLIGARFDSPAALLSSSGLHSPLATSSPRATQGGAHGGALARSRLYFYSLCPSWTTSRKPSA